MQNENKLMERILSENKPVFLEFFAPWCSPCQVQKAVMTRFMDKHSDEVKLFAVDVDTNKNISKYFSIKSVPTVIYMKNGEILCRKSGIMNEDALAGIIEGCSS